MRREIKNFIKLCKKDQKELKGYLKTRLEQFGYSPVSKDGYLFARGSDIMVTAHMDTVHKDKVREVKIEKYKDFDKGLELTGFGKFFTNTKDEKDDSLTVISSPQGIGGDDRCGVYMILELLKKGYRPTVLFCEDEEIGGVGSNKFTMTGDIDTLSKMKYILELDRANEKDAVYYDCGNKEFEKYINSFGFETDYGSFSDIGHLSPCGNNASVNLSCGYYRQHTLDEYVIFEEMEATIEKVCKLLDDEKNIKEKFDYQEIRNWGIFDSYGYNSKLSSSYYDERYVIHFMKGDNIYLDMVYAYSAQEALWEWMMKNPETEISYNDIVDILSDWEFECEYGMSPEQYASILSPKETANEYILSQLEEVSA